jgi:hypothetical protein
MDCVIRYWVKVRNPASIAVQREHACLRGQFASGATPSWEFDRDGEVVRIDPVGPLMVRLGAAVDLAVSAAVAGLGITTCSRTGCGRRSTAARGDANSSSCGAAGRC